MAELRDYPLKATDDAAAAIADALAKFLEGVEFSMPRGPEVFRFARVVREWAEFRDKAASPAAVVLPDATRYVDGRMTPTCDERTWSGGDPNECDEAGAKLHPLGDGSGDGFALFTLCDVEVPLLVVVRAKTKPQRRAILRRLELLFAEDGARVDPMSLDPRLPIPDELADDHPVRFGRVVTVDGHYGRPARLTLTTATRLDGDKNAVENRWMAQLEIAAQMPLCALRRVRGMKIETRLISGDAVVGSEGD